MSNWIEVSRAADWDMETKEGKRTLKGYHIRFEGMAYPTTMYLYPGEGIEELIERARKRYSAREKEREGEI